jgi:hypothetical protein
MTARDGMLARILIGCETSGVVRNAFAALGHDAWSCDLEPSETAGNHIVDDVLNIVVRGKWDLLIAHPPCTDLAVSGAWLFEKKGDRIEYSLELVKELLSSPIPRIAIENPISIISTRIRPPDQIIQPWWFGHDTRKATCLWLKNLPKLKATDPILTFRDQTLEMSQNVDRAKNRSRTYSGVAKAMAEQWGRLL